MISLPDKIGSIQKSIDNVKETVEKLGPTASGLILVPQNGAVVDRIFDYKLELKYAKTEKHYYLLNQIGGMYWPKTRINLSNSLTTYQGQSNEGGNPPNGRFDVVLLEVDQSEHERILEWLSGTTFPGMQIVGTELSRVYVTLK